MDFKAYNETDPDFHNPRFQRRVVSVERPIPIVKNMFDAVLDCGHSPLIFGERSPQPGDMVFCPDCKQREAA